MIRAQVQFTEDQARRLKEAARRRGVSIADLVRQGVDAILERETEPPREERIRRAITAAGRHRSADKDVAVEHDKYLGEAYRT